MSLGMLALLFAGVGAGWLLLRLSRGGAIDANDQNMTILKVVVLLGIVAALAVARLGPLAFMVLIAAGGVMAIETWRARTIANDQQSGQNLPTKPGKAMTLDEASAVLGISPEASPDEVRAAHRKLITQIHPDKGGTDYLASKINEARDMMLERTLDD